MWEGISKYDLSFSSNILKIAILSVIFILLHTPVPERERWSILMSTCGEGEDGSAAAAGHHQHLPGSGARVKGIVIVR